MTSLRFQDSPGRVRDVEAESLRLRQFAESVRKLDSSLPELERFVLDSLMEFLRCERGWIVRVQAPPTAEPEPVASLSLDIRRAREAVEDDSPGSGRFVDQEDPEFSLPRGAIREAIRELEPVLVKDSLIEPSAGGGDAHHSVLCQPISLTPERAVVVCLARRLGETSFSDEDLESFRELVWFCLPALQVAYLGRQFEGDVTAWQVTKGPEPERAEEGLGETEAVWSHSEEEIPGYHGMIGKSPRLMKIIELVEKIKDTDFNVCIFGESGTGKELLARAIHRAGKRREGEFISENCGAISETLLESELFGYVKGAFTGADENRKGLFELADRGILFLDEIGDMSPGMQRKLLRVLQEGVIRPVGSKKVVRVDVRVLCASNRDLRTLVEQGSFRADLYYRLNVINIEVPPLRERLEDVPCLVQHLLKQIEEEEGVRRRFSDSAFKALLAYNWPGNIRELANVLRRLMITDSRRVVTRREVLPLLSGGPARTYIGDGTDELDDQIHLRIPRRSTFNEIIAECEKAVLLNALRENRWNKSRVTKVLQIPRQSLYNKIAKYGLQRRPSKSAAAPSRD